MKSRLTCKQGYCSAVGLCGFLKKFCQTLFVRALKILSLPRGRWRSCYEFKIFTMEGFSHGAHRDLCQHFRSTTDLQMVWKDHHSDVPRFAHHDETELFRIGKNEDGSEEL